jgi:hypothetical protein
LFYSQQIRPYALLGVLSLLVVLFAERALGSGKTKYLVGLSLVGLLCLFTHYVGSWLWCGIGIATLLWEAGGAIPAWNNSGLQAVCHRATAGAALAGGFGLALLCPWFDPPELASTKGLWGVGFAAATALVLVFGRSGSDLKQSGLSKLLLLVLAFASPVILFLAWLIPVGILGLFSHAKSGAVDSYGFEALAQFLGLYTGMQYASEPWLQAMGLFLVLSGLYFCCLARPRQASLLLGWVLIPISMAMAVQNPLMNLPRYLFGTLPGILIMVSVSLVAASDGLSALIAPLVRVIPIRARSSAGGIAPVFLAAAIVGFPSFTALPFPTIRTNFENYPAVSAKLKERDTFLLLGESHNLIRALSWYLDRQGCQSVKVFQESPRIAAVNIFLDNRLWHPEISKALKLEQAERIEGDFGEIAMYQLRPDVSLAETSHAPLSANAPVTLSGKSLLGFLVNGSDVAWAEGHSGGLVQLYKSRPGRALFRIRHGFLDAGEIMLEVKGLVAGRASNVQAVLSFSGDPLAKTTVVLDAISDSLTTHQSRAASGSVSLDHALSPGELEVEVYLNDDNSGAIYSSNAVLQGFALSVRR